MSQVKHDGVQGSLDSPPIVIRSATEKTLFLVLVGGVFCIGSFAMINDPRAHIVGYAVLVFGALCLCAGLWQLISSQRLTISPEGIVFFNSLKTQRYVWDEISEFVAYQPSYRSNIRHVGVIREIRPGEGSRWQMFTKGMTGVHATFGNAWPMSAPELADLLNSARDKWGKDSDAGLTAK